MSGVMSGLLPRPTSDGYGTPIALATNRRADTGADLLRGSVMPTQMPVLYSGFSECAEQWPVWLPARGTYRPRHAAPSALTRFFRWMQRPWTMIAGPGRARWT